jgi:hypothetical protein
MQKRNNKRIIMVVMAAARMPRPSQQQRPIAVRESFDCD